MNHSAKLDEVLEALGDNWYGEPIAGTWPAFWSGREYHDGDFANGRIWLYATDNEVVLQQMTSAGVVVCQARYSEAFPAAVIASALEFLILSLLDAGVDA